jgi:hypothetical protein
MNSTKFNASPKVNKGEKTMKKSMSEKFHEEQEEKKRSYKKTTKEKPEAEESEEPYNKSQSKKKPEPEQKAKKEAPKAETTAKNLDLTCRFAEILKVALPKNLHYAIEKAIFPDYVTGDTIILTLDELKKYEVMEPAGEKKEALKCMLKACLENGGFSGTIEILQK